MEIDPKEFLKSKSEVTNKKKVLMYPGDMAGCCHYRLLVPMYTLLKTGKYNCKMSTTISPEQHGWNPNTLVFSRQHQKDVQKQMNEWRKESNPRLVYDVDDNLFNLYPSNPGQKSFQSLKKDLIDTIKMCDVLTVSTTPLKEVYKKIHPNIRILPNQVLSQYASLRVPNNTDKIRIGWAGTNTHVSDFEEAYNALIDVAKRHRNVKFVFFGYHPKNIDKELREDQFEFQKYVPISKYHLTLGLLKLDIGIAPLKDNQFNEGKSNLKILEYGVYKIPTIASPVYPYKTTIEDGVDGIIIDKNKRKKWRAALNQLIEETETRKQMGEAIFKKVMSQYAIENNIHWWEEVYFD